MMAQVRNLPKLINSGPYPASEICELHAEIIDVVNRIYNKIRNDGKPELTALQAMLRNTLIEANFKTLAICMLLYGGNLKGEDRVKMNEVTEIFKEHTEIQSTHFEETFKDLVKRKE